MKDETEGLELVRVKGKLYSLGSLFQLAERGAAVASANSKNRRTFTLQLEEGSERDHAFRVSSSSGMPAVYLRVRIEKDDGNVSVTRTLETISKPPPEPWQAEVESRTLEPLRLDLNASGDPVAYLKNELLDEAAIINALINPIREAVGDLP
jgi:hypothetical protein